MFDIYIITKLVVILLSHDVITKRKGMNIELVFLFLHHTILPTTTIQIGFLRENIDSLMHSPGSLTVFEVLI